MALMFLYDEHRAEILDNSIKILQERLAVSFILLQHGHEIEKQHDNIQAIASELANVAMQIKHQKLKETKEVKN